MKNKAILLPFFLLAGVLLPLGCNRSAQEVTPQDDYRTTQSSPGYYYYDRDYEVWIGPGWYYGIYFSNEGRYRDWRRNHWWRGYPRGRYYWRGGRGRWERRGQGGSGRRAWSGRGGGGRRDGARGGGRGGRGGGGRGGRGGGGGRGRH